MSVDMQPVLAIASSVISDARTCGSRSMDALKTRVAGLTSNALQQGDRFGSASTMRMILGLASSASRLVCDKQRGPSTVLAIDRSTVGPVLGAAAAATARVRPAMRLATYRDYAVLKLLTA
jgi:hypothetical protein